MALKGHGYLPPISCHVDSFGLVLSTAKNFLFYFYLTVIIGFCLVNVVEVHLVVFFFSNCFLILKLDMEN